MWRNLAYIGAIIAAASTALLNSVDAPFTLAALGACTLATCVLAIWRHHVPWPFALAGLAAAACGDIGVALPGLFALGLRRHARTVFLVLIPTAIAALPPAVRSTPDGSPLDIGSAWLITLVIAAVALLTGVQIGTRRELVASLRSRAETAEHERSLRAREAVLLERTRIAREMHDVLGHKLSLLTLQAGALEVNATNPDAVERAAGEMRTTARAALEDLRGVIGALREDASPEDAPREPVAGIHDIAELVEQSRRSGATATLTDDVDDATRDALDGPTGRAIHRVIQESLSNAHTHAPGQPVAVTVTRVGDRVRVLVENSIAAGGPVDPGTGTGLDGLAERVRLVDGAFSAEHHASAFRVRADIPVPDTAGSDA